MMDHARGRGRLLVGVAGLYALALLAWHALRHTPVAAWWPFALLDIFGWVFYAPLLLLIPLAALARARHTLARLAALLLLFAWDYGPAFLPHRTLGGTGGERLRVLSANLVWTNDSVASLEAVVERERPDVVALQELGDGMAAALAGRLRDRYPHRALHPSSAPDGMGVLSRHPILAAAPPEMGAGRCACQDVAIDLGGQSVTILNVHPEPPAVDLRFVRRLPLPVGYDERAQAPSLAALLARIDASAGPLVVLGDFNTGDRQPFYRTLRSRLRDAYREAGWGFGFTFPQGEVDGWPVPPLVRIDYVFHDAAWATNAAWTGRLPESNHRYIVTDLMLR